MIDYILFGLMGLSFLFVCLGALYVCKQKQFEDSRLNSSLNSLIVGMSFLALALLVNSVQYGLNLFTKLEIVLYAPYVEVVCVSLMAIFFLVGIVVMKEICN